MAKRRKKNGSLLYSRMQGGEERWYADLRSRGGGREALKPDGSNLATTDHDEAVRLLADRLDELEEEKRRGDSAKRAGLTGSTTLAELAQQHLIWKAEHEEKSERWLVQVQQKLEDAVAFFGANREPRDIQVLEVRKWIDHLKATKKGRSGGSISNATIRHYLFTLSNLFERGIELGYMSQNPVRMMSGKPRVERAEADFLEVHEAAKLLEAAKEWEAVQTLEQEHGGAIGPQQFPWMHALLATFLLTGGRQQEVLGLGVRDVSRAAKTVTFRPNKWRDLKTRTSHRTIPLWPQLEDILFQYIAEREREGGIGDLLFPSHRADEEAPLDNVKKSLEAIAERAGLDPVRARRTKVYRHTYCSTRLMTVQRVLRPGKKPSDPAAWEAVPVSQFEVAKEMGHGGTALVERIYGHVQNKPKRGDVVEYRRDEEESTTAAPAPEAVTD